MCWLKGEHAIGWGRYYGVGTNTTGAWIILHLISSHVTAQSLLDYKSESLCYSDAKFDSLIETPTRSSVENTSRSPRGATRTGD